MGLFSPQTNRAVLGLLGGPINLIPGVSGITDQAAINSPIAGGQLQPQQETAAQRFQKLVNQRLRQQQAQGRPQASAQFFQQLPQRRTQGFNLTSAQTRQPFGLLAARSAQLKQGFT